MSKLRTAARKDTNHNEIADVFRSLGWEVLDVSQLKKCCDIFVSKHSNTIAVEIKDGAKPPSARRLTEGEQEFKDSWKGHYALVTTAGDVLMLNSRFFAYCGH